MFKLRTEVQFHNAIQESERKMLAPMVEIAQFASSLFLRRAPKGIGADNSRFLPYVDPPRANLRGGGAKLGHYWAPPGEPQPTKNKLYMVRGFAVYKNYKAYKAGMNQHTRTYNKTGTLWSNLRVQLMSPTKVRVQFAGRNKKGLTNNKLARIITHREPRSILDLGAKETSRVRQFVADTLPASYLDALKISEMGFKARKQLATAQRRLKKAQQLFEQARRAV